MWPFKKQETKTIQETLYNQHLDGLQLRISVLLTKNDFENNLARVTEVAGKLEPIVQMLRTKQRELARLEKYSSLNRKDITMSEDTTTPGEEAKPEATPEGAVAPSVDAPAAE